MESMNHLVIYSDDNKVEEFSNWDQACLRFSWLCNVWPEVQLQSWSHAAEAYKPMAVYRETPYFAMRNLQEEYRRKVEHSADAGKMV